jgi:hypothetical protein
MATISVINLFDGSYYVIVGYTKHIFHSLEAVNKFIVSQFTNSPSLKIQVDWR